eukprot:96621-Lingulodinium_polyedra.AAC.1
MPCDVPDGNTSCSGGPQPWAVYCCTCDMWLNGSAQFMEHCSGKKHKRNAQAQRLPRPSDSQ